jgi:hypothetical protein
VAACASDCAHGPPAATAVGRACAGAAAHIRIGLSTVWDASDPAAADVPSDATARHTAAR